MRKSLWSPDEDEKLKQYITQHGCGNWSDVAKHTGLKRCGKSCRLRWINYLRPDLKRGAFMADEIRLIVNLHRELGNSWSKIASYLPGRTDNDIKNFWHSYTRSRRGEQSTSRVTTNDPDNRNTSHGDRQALMNIHDYDNSNSGGCRSSVTARQSVNSSSPLGFSDSSILVNNFSFSEQHNASGKVQNEANSLSMKTSRNNQLNNPSTNYNYAASDYQLLLAAFDNTGNQNLLQELAIVGELNQKLLSPPEGLQYMIWGFLNQHHNQASPQLISNPTKMLSHHSQQVINSNYINAVAHYTVHDADVGLIKDLEHHQQIPYLDDLMGTNTSFQLSQSPDPMDICRSNQLQRSYLQS